MTYTGGAWTIPQSGPFLAVGAESLPSYNFVPASGIGWRRGLNNALNGVRSAKILAVGDSTTRGFGDSVDGKGWSADLASTLSGRGFNATRGLVIPEFQRSGQAVDPRISLVGANWTLEAAYVNALAAAAASQNWMMIDLFTRWGGQNGYATLNPQGWYFDNIHPDPVGYWDIATTVATALDNF